MDRLFLEDACWFDLIDWQITFPDLQNILECTDLEILPRNVNQLEDWIGFVPRYLILDINSQVNNQIKTNCLPTVLKHIPEAPVSIGNPWTKTTLPVRKIASENAGFWNLSGAWHTITGKYRFNRSVYEQRQGQTWCALFLPGVFNLFSLRERWLLRFYFPFSFFLPFGSSSAHIYL